MPLKKILKRWYIAREKNYLKVVHSGWKITGLVLEQSVSYKQHVELIDAIINKDFRKAESTLKKHINGIKRFFL